jgi:hypothetical protein
MPLPTDSLSMADISTDLQNYALDHQEHIIAQVSEVEFGGLPNSPIVPLGDYVMFLPTNGEVVLTDFIVNDPLQPGAKGTFDPKNNVVGFKTRKAKPEPIKVDLKFTEQKIRAMYNTYLGRVKTGKFDPETYPYEEDIIKKILVAVRKNMRLAMWKGIANPTGTSSLDLFDGWIRQIQNTITNAPSTINLVSLNALTASNVVTEFEKLKKALPENIRYSGEGVMIVSTAHKDLYEEGYRQTFGPLAYNTGFNKMTLDGSNIEIIVEQGVSAFARPMITTRENLVYLYDDDPSKNNVEFDYQKRDRSLAYLMDFFGGVGICATERIWVGAFA